VTFKARLSLRVSVTVIQVYPSLAPLAEDVVSIPASEAYCERVFSVCGELSAGKCNQLCVSMEQRVFLKLSRQLYCPN